MHQLDLAAPCGRHNPLNIFAAHEICAFADYSMATKMTVHFNLFGGTPRTLHQQSMPVPVKSEADSRLQAYPCTGISRLELASAVQAQC